MLLFQGCEEPGKNKAEVLVANIPEKSEPIQKAEEEIFTGDRVQKYYLDSIRDWQYIEALLKDYTAVQKEIILSLNRIDERRLKPGLELIIPDEVSENFFDYSPFPEQLNLLDSIPKTLVINQRIQAFGIYENGYLCYWGPVSSGKESTPTPNGLHYANFKAKRKVSTVNPSWILPYYFNFMNFEGVGVHQYTMPGFPASHACVRLYMDDAKYIYDWSDMWKLNGNQLARNGTPFMVFGKYDFKKPSPWLGLAKNPKANNLNKEELDTLQNYVIRYHSDSLNFIKPEAAGQKLLL